MEVWIDVEWVSDELWVRTSEGWRRWSAVDDLSVVGAGTVDDPYAISVDRGDEILCDGDDPQVVLAHIGELHRQHRESQSWSFFTGPEPPAGRQYVGNTTDPAKPDEASAPESFPFPIKYQNGQPWIENSGSDWRIYLEVPVTLIKDPDSSWSIGPARNSFEVEKDTATQLVAVVGGDTSEPLDLVAALKARGLL